MSSEGRPSHLKLYSLLAVMVLLWSANFVVAKYVLRDLPPLLAVGLRTSVAGFAMLGVYRWWIRRNERYTWRRRDVPLLIGLGLTGVGVNQLCFVLGMANTSVSHAAVIMGLIPLLVLTIAAVSGIERMSLGRMAGMMTALGGVAILQTGGARGGGHSLTGDLFIFLAALTFAIFTVLGKTHVGRLGGVTVNTFAYIVSAICLLPLTVSMSAGFDFGAVRPGTWIALLYMALFPSVLCYLIYYYALNWIPASRVSALAYFQPLLATLIAIPTLGEYPTWSLVSGGAVVLTGVFMAERL